MFFKKKEKPICEATIFDTIARSIVLDDKTYVIHGAKQYATKIEINLNIVSEDENGSSKIDKETITIPYSAEQRLVPFEFRGNALFWDIRDNALRYRPSVDWSKKEEINKSFHIIDQNLVWVQKKYAERNLSKECLSYAYPDMDGNYCWSKIDYSSTPVFLELYRLMAEFNGESDPTTIGIAFDEAFSYATVYTPHYATYYCDELIGSSSRVKGDGSLMSLYCVTDFYNRELFDVED